tara:strand:- start:67 stop:696 length:630 start_codon:yes stop_codon:yes gene_type:complete
MGQNRSYSEQNNKSNIASAITVLIKSYDSGGKLLICGNGGSAADCEHIAGELMKGFKIPRTLNSFDRDKLAKTCGDDVTLLTTNLQYGLPAISLVSQSSLITAIANDLGGELIFAQQVWGIGKSGDVLLAISTSGNSKNVLLAAKVAKVRGIAVVGLTGRGGGELATFCDVLIDVDSNDVAKIQELHLPIYHEICRRVESHYFAESKPI